MEDSSSNNEKNVVSSSSPGNNDLNQIDDQNVIKFVSVNKLLWSHFTRLVNFKKCSVSLSFLRSEKDEK